ncbi:MAG: hypothetical protein WEB89_03065 [Balneolales bacterium]
MENLFTEFLDKTRKFIDEHEVYRIDKSTWYNCDIDQYVWFDELTNDKVVMQQIYKTTTSAQTKFYCPLCDSHHAESEYLATAFKNDKTKWLANMITHYRHSHINSWDKVWGVGGYGYHNLSQLTYSFEKEKINNFAKQQIVKEATDYLLYHNITELHFKALHGTNKKTLSLAGKMLKI